MAYADMSWEATLKYRPDLTAGAYILVNCIRNNPSARMRYFRAAWADQSPSFFKNWSKSFDCALMSTLETFDEPENGCDIH